MFPMIGSLEEFREARQVVVQAVQELSAAGGDVRMPRVGMMLEIPAVVETMDSLVKEADFFSVGTNDFVQYMLAADRANQRVATYYCAHHPAILRAVSRMIRISLAAGKDISVCGEMAHDPHYVPFFVGVGVRRLSLDPSYMPSLQALIGRVSVPEAEAYAERLLACESRTDVESALQEF